MHFLLEIKNNIQYYQPGWVLIILLLGIVFLGYINSAYKNRFDSFLKAVFITRYSHQLSREEQTLSHPVSIFLSVNFILITALFILQLITSTTFSSNVVQFSFLSFLFIAGIILLIYLIKTIFLIFLAFIIDKKGIIGEYIFTTFLINQMLGIFLIPVVIFIAYSNQLLLNSFIYFGIILLILSFFIRIWKGVLAVFQGSDTTLFYIILYLCTLEIMPVLICVRWIERLV